MKVTTDACLFGAWLAKEVKSEKLKVKTVLDIGTGTGLLSLMFVQENDVTNIDAIEIDEAAAAQAKENVASSKWKDLINIINTDARSFSFERKYDVIISNPPFYEKEIKSANENKNIAHHSENLTLEELLILIKEYLNPDGNFFLLLPYKRNEEIKKLFKDHQLHISKIVFVKQSVKHDYFRIMLKGKSNQKKNEETEFDEISIWNEKQEYTTEFTELLKDYYLYL
jgi:tRNA1Val (adenine37-N6)-methyltransferase